LEPHYDPAIIELNAFWHYGCHTLVTREAILFPCVVCADSKRLSI